MRPVAVRGFALVAYAAFLASFAFFTAFLLGATPARPAGGAGALAVDVALVAAFGATHSALARAGVKRWMARAVPAPALRSVFVLVASVQLAAIAYAWRPLRGAPLWSVSGAPAAALVVLELAGVALALVSTFLIDHLELCGLRQAFSPASPPPPFQVRSLYRHVRHPLYLGLLIAFWAAPTMSLGRLCLASALTAYLLVGVRLEERDLVQEHGDAYRRYRSEVPMLLPRALARRDVTPPNPTARAAPAAGAPPARSSRA